MTNRRRVLVTGSRNWADVTAVWQSLDAQAALGPMVLVHDDCPTGADKIADDWARARAVPVERHPADWGAYGKSAGPRRNQEMVDLGADVCLAYPEAVSRGTRHCMSRAEAAGIPVQEVAVGTTTPA
jgi:hypothetical protein